MEKPLTIFVDRVARRYVAVGLLCTAAGYLTIAAAVAAGIGDFLANALAFVVGLSLSFVLNSRWVFGHSGNTGHWLRRFLVCFALAYGVNLAVLFAFRDGFGVSSTASLFAAFTAYSVAFYLLNRLWGFRGDAG